MIIVLKPHTSEENIHRVENLVKKHGLDTHLVQGTGMTIIGCIGDTTLIDPRQFEIDTCVDKVMYRSLINLQIAHFIRKTLL